MNRREFLRFGAGGAFACAATPTSLLANRSTDGELFRHPPAYSVVPVVGDGKWIWKKPPEGETGYLEPRQYEASIGIEIQGNGNAVGVNATTAVPVKLPEQQIDDVQIETEGAQATVRQVAPEAGQLFLAARGIARGQTIGAVARFRLTLSKEYHGYSKDQFPAEQVFSKEFRKLYMYDSPGIQTRQQMVKELASNVGGQLDHPWDKAKAFHEWVWTNIKARRGYYTSVIEAIRDKVGDCEERAAVFVALCRVSGIPARLVWVPNHNWAEFYLKDRDGEGHWIPSHTSAYSWFGWTGAHELVLQKGDSIRVPEKKKPLRLMADWMQWQGSRPKARYFAELKPIAAESSQDAGPGARSKDEKGEWVRVGNHPLDKHTRE